MTDTFKTMDSKKYMWDGVTYENVALTEETKAKYEKEGFETALVQENGKYLLYTRRVPTTVTVEGAPPP